MPSNFCGYYRYEMCVIEDCTKIAKFGVKTTPHRHRSGDIDRVQQRSRFAQKGCNWWRIMGIWLWHWNQTPIIPIEASRRAKTKKAPQIRSNVKVWFNVFLDCNGVVHHELLSQGRTVNKEYNLEVRRRLRKAIHKKSTEFWKSVKQLKFGRLNCY